MQQLLLWLGLLELLSGVPAVIQTLKGSEVGLYCALCFTSVMLLERLEATP